MLKYINRPFIVSIFFMCSMGVFAQKNEEIEETDSVKIEFELMPKSFRFGIDLVGVVRTFTESEYTEIDFTSDIAIDKFLLNFDYGLMEKNRVADEIDYHVAGNFFRVGIDYNILKKHPNGNAFFVGLKYARGKSDHSLTYSFTDPYFGTIDNVARDFNAVSVRWFELNTGVKVKVFRELWFGFTGRLKFAVKYDHSLELDPYELPGYGFADRKFNWGFDYYLFYRIPFFAKK